MMTHAEEIVQAVAILIKQGMNIFSRKDVRDQIGVGHDVWVSGYTAIFQGMRIDHPGRAPSVNSKFKNVFERVEHGKYILTPYGKQLVQAYSKYISGFQNNASSLDYDKLTESEKVALIVAITFPHRTLISVLPKLFKWKASDSTYYRYHREGYDKLIDKGLLKDGKPTELAFKILPQNILLQIVKDLREEIMTLYNETSKTTNELWESRRNLSQLKEEYIFLEKENERIKSEIERFIELRELKEKIDFTNIYDELKLILSKSLAKDVDKAIELFKRDEYDSAIVKSYVITEILLHNLYKIIYGIDDAKKVRKHEHRLKKIWNDDQLEKYKYPGIQLVASLFSIILWYRNKMGAHRELPPTIEAARISINALLQSLKEIRRLGFTSVFS